MIYSKKATPAQKKWLLDYELATTFEPMHQDELDSGVMTFEQVVRANQQWFERWVGDAMNAIPEPPDA